MRRRILSLVDTLETGGAEISLAEIYGRFRELDVVVCRLYPGDGLRPLYEERGLEVIGIDLPGRYDFRRRVREVASLVQRLRPEGLHSTLFRASQVGRWVSRRTGVPLLDSLVNDSYGADRWRELSAVSRVKLLAVRSLDRATAPLAERFVANSEVLKAAAVRDLRVPAERIEVIPRGRDASRFAPPALEVTERLRAELGLQGARPILLNVARLRNRKGQRDLIDAMPPILARVPRARLLIAGAGPERTDLEARIAELGLTGSIALLGERQDVPTLLHLADLFVFPSHFEGLPGSLIEAMLAGRPIVASDTPHHRECVTAGRTASLVPPRSPERLAAAVLELVRDPAAAERMGQRARDAALERFAIERVATRYEHLLEGLASRRAGAR